MRNKLSPQCAAVSATRNKFVFSSRLSSPSSVSVYDTRRSVNCSKPWTGGGNSETPISKPSQSSWNQHENCRGGGWTPPQFMSTDVHFWVKSGFKFQSLGKISNISTSDPQFCRSFSYCLELYKCPPRLNEDDRKTRRTKHVDNLDTGLMAPSCWHQIVILI